MVTTRIRLAIVLLKAILRAITAANKVICLAIVRKLKKKGHVISADRPVICLAIVQKAGIVVAVAVVVVVAAWEARRVRNVINVGKWDILRATAVRAVVMEAVTAAVIAEAGVEAEVVVVATAAVCEVKLVTLVEATVICREIAHKVKNATTVCEHRFVQLIS